MKLTPFVIQKIEEKLNCVVSEKGACAELRRNLINADSEDGRFALNTIKRWFGLVEKQVEPLQNGLEAIAEYLGYPSWVALTLEPEYNQTKVKTEEDYISELFPEYTSLLQGIQDYQFKKSQAKTERDVLYYERKIDELKRQQNTLKDAIVQLCNLVTDPTPFQTDLSNIETLLEGKRYEEVNKLLDEDRLKEEQSVLHRSLKKKDSEEELIQYQLNKNAYCFYLKAEICRSFNKLNEAERFYLLSLESMRVFNVLFKLGEFYFVQKKNCQQALIFFNEIKSRKEEVLLEVNANHFFSMGEKLGGPSIFLNTVFYLGRIYLNQKDFETGNKAMVFLLAAYSIIAEDESYEHKKELALRIAAVYNEQGNALLNEKDVENSIAMLKRALDIYSEYSKRDFAETTINLAYSYIEVPDFEAAEELLGQSLAYYSSQFKETADEDMDEKLCFRLGIAKSHYAFGYLHKRKQDYESSLKSFKRALVVFEKMEEIRPSLEVRLEIAEILYTLEGLYSKLGDTKKYEEAIQRTTQYFNSNPDVNKHWRQEMFDAFEEK